VGPTEIVLSPSAGLSLLAAAQLLPLAAAGIVLALHHSRWLWLLGVALGVVELALVVAVYRAFDAGLLQMQLVESLALGPLRYHAAVDGLSIAFMLLTAIVTLLVLLYGVVLRQQPYARFLAAVFGLEATVMGMFTTLNLLWFVALSAVELALIAYLLGQWSTSPERELAIRRYQQFMGIGLLLLVTGALLLGWNHADATGAWSFDLTDLLKVEEPQAIRSLLFFLLFYGLALRVPLFPLHGWLPITAEHGTVAVAPVFLLGLKIGIYGLLRFVFPLLPDAVLFWHKFVVGFAVAGIFYAAILALLQTNLRRLLAYAVVSHTSVLVIGLFSLSHTAFQSAVMLSVDFGIAIAGLFLITGLVLRRTNTMVLARLGGLWDRIPVIGAAFLVAALSIVGMPGTPGFDAAHLMLEAAIERFGGLVTIAAALGNVAAAAFLLLAFQRAFLAPPTGRAATAPVATATAAEWVLAGLVIAILLGTGFWSEPWMALTAGALEPLAAHFPHP
jgi:NADH-quinone oxidoreductase subunit M